jgi:hypothetical protein
MAALTPRRHAHQRKLGHHLRGRNRRAADCALTCPGRRDLGGSGCPGGGLVLLDHAGGDPAAVADRDALSVLAAGLRGRVGAEPTASWRMAASNRQLAEGRAARFVFALPVSISETRF